MFALYKPSQLSLKNNSSENQDCEEKDKLTIWQQVRIPSLN